MTNTDLHALKSLCCLCHSDDILQSYQPAVQHHLRVLHWGHLSSHDSLQHVSYLRRLWFIHRSPAEAHWFIYQKLVNSARDASPVSEGRLTTPEGALSQLILVFYLPTQFLECAVLQQAVNLPRMYIVSPCLLCLCCSTAYFTDRF